MSVVSSNALIVGVVGESPLEVYAILFTPSMFAKIDRVTLQGSSKMQGAYTLFIAPASLEYNAV
jgi:hypothetical protein